MGGYGALRNGLSYLDTFGTIIALSNKVLTKSSKEHFDAAYPIYQRLQGIVQTDRAEKMPDEMDIESLVLNALEQPEKKPDLYLACGTEDDIFQENKDLHQFLVKHSYQHKYIEAPGKHDWDFWNATIKDSMEWLYGENKN